MAYINLNTSLPNFDKWVDLREVANPNKNAPAVYVRQDGKGVTFLACDYKKTEGTVNVKTLSVLNADKALYEWQNV